MSIFTAACSSYPNNLDIQGIRDRDKSLLERIIMIDERVAWDQMGVQELAERLRDLQGSEVVTGAELHRLHNTWGGKLWRWNPTLAEARINSRHWRALKYYRREGSAAYGDISIKRQLLINDVAMISTVATMHDTHLSEAAGGGATNDLQTRDRSDSFLGVIFSKYRIPVDRNDYGLTHATQEAQRQPMGSILLANQEMAARARGPQVDRFGHAARLRYDLDSIF